MRRLASRGNRRTARGGTWFGRSFIPGHFHSLSCTGSRGALGSRQVAAVVALALRRAIMGRGPGRANTQCRPGTDGRRLARCLTTVGATTCGSCPVAETVILDRDRTAASPPAVISAWHPRGLSTLRIWKPSGRDGSPSFWSGSPRATVRRGAVFGLSSRRPKVRRCWPMRYGSGWPRSAGQAHFSIGASAGILRRTWKSIARPSPGVSRKRTRPRRWS